MEKPKSILPEKSISFRETTEKKHASRPSRTLSMNYIRSHMQFGGGGNDSSDRGGVAGGDRPNTIPEADPVNSGCEDFVTVGREIDGFLATTAAATDQVPFSVIEKFVGLVEDQVKKIEGSEERRSKVVLSLIEAIGKLPKLTAKLAELPPEQNRDRVFNLTDVALQAAMDFLELEFNLLLECPEADKVEVAENDAGDGQKALFPAEVVEKLERIADTMVSAGYDRECYRVFGVHRRRALAAAMAAAGFEKTSIDEVQKMTWENLEGEIPKWNAAFKRFASDSFSLERDLWRAVFSSQPAAAAAAFGDLSSRLLSQLLHFAEAVSMTKRSSEKLFKLLDMYETLSDSVPKLQEVGEMAIEVSEVRLHLGEAALRVFRELEKSIRSDTAKTTVPGGAVHPLTRYVLNYVKYVGEYKNTLTLLFEEHHQRASASEACSSGEPEKFPEASDEQDQSPFAAEMKAVMDLLADNLEGKSRLYKDLSLSYIFLMNNGRYMLQKVKGSPEIKEMLGDQWCRKRSSELRQYHKSYKRETWGRVLDCLRDEGLQTNKRGSVSKPVLKERFKIFNSTIDEILRTQSGWVVSDEQLQSELRISVSAVVVPAYRSFLGRFAQYLDAGRQTEKYIKFGPEKLESCIDDLFDGNQSSMVKRRS